MSSYHTTKAVIIAWLVLFTCVIYAQDDLYPAPGKIYSINGHDMHLYCIGEGNPPVILEAGVGGFSLNWSWVQPELAKTRRVCSYDRPGYGWSEVVEREFDMGITVDELNMLLRDADVKAPHVMVGHSFGGTILRAYREQYPENVLGIVFVDAVSPEMPARIENYPEALTVQMEGLRLFSSFARLAAIQSEDSTLPVPTNVPEAWREIYIEKLLEPNFFEASFIEAMYLINDLPKLTLASDLGDLPIVVLRHGIPESFGFLGAPMNIEQAQAAEISWQELQKELAGLSSNSTFIVAEESGHNIQFDQPELVIEAVYRVLE